MKPPLPLNTFKTAITQGQRQIGLWGTLCSPICAELAADAGFDWILFDSEHSPVEIAGLLPLLQAAARGDSHCAVRVAWNDPVLIKRVLDLGAQTVFVPFVQNRDDARAAVAACRYPPKGVRGVAGVTRATRYGRVADYANCAAEQVCVIVQIETAQALEQIDEIAQTEGVDGVFIGPSDLAASMGHAGNPDHPDVQAAIRQAAADLLRIRKASGILARNAIEAINYVEWGYTFVAAGVDAGVFTKAVDTLREDVAKGMPNG